MNISSKENAIENFTCKIAAICFWPLYVNTYWEYFVYSGSIQRFYAIILSTNVNIISLSTSTWANISSFTHSFLDQYIWFNVWVRYFVWNFKGTFEIPHKISYPYNSYIFMKENAFEMVVCEMAAILSRPWCVKSYTCFLWQIPQLSMILYYLCRMQT